MWPRFMAGAGSVYKKRVAVYKGGESNTVVRICDDTIECFWSDLSLAIWTDHWGWMDSSSKQPQALDEDGWSICRRCSTSLKITAETVTNNCMPYMKHLVEDRWSLDGTLWRCGIHRRIAEEEGKSEEPGVQLTHRRTGGRTSASLPRMSLPYVFPEYY